MCLVPVISVSSYRDSAEMTFAVYKVSQLTTSERFALYASFTRRCSPRIVSNMCEDINNIHRYGKDILQITGQDEVMQSFVRVELGEKYDDDGSEKEKKTTSFKVADDYVDDKEDETRTTRRKESLKSAEQRTTYHQLGAREYNNFSKFTKSKRGGKRSSKKEQALEEIYTDKDRAAAVNLGSRDIKQSLKLKRRQDISRILEISEEEHPGFLLSLGNRELRNQEVKVAINFVNKALELNPYDKNALVTRSKCHLLLGEINLALQDAEKALTQDKKFIKAIYQKAEALYHLGKFEYSLMYFHRGLHLRPEMDDFRLGVQKAQQAIENTIGGNVEPCLNSSKSECKKNAAAVNEESGRCVRRSADSSRLLLKDLFIDKKYLENLLNNPDIQRADNSSHTIKTEIKEGMQFLENRQQFWKQYQTIHNKK